MHHAVAIVAEREFGDRLSELVERIHVWVCATPVNRRFAETYWSARPAYSLERGITTFNVVESDTSEEMVIGVLDSVDLHHGEHSHTPPWSVLEVYGASATGAVRAELSRFGVTEVTPTSKGFICTRPAGGAA
jgi:hypothetical protein